MTFSGRNYYEIYMLLLTAGWALFNWVTGVDGETIEAAFPGWGRHIFLGGLLFSSLFALGGIAVGTVIGMLVERAALFALAGSLIYCMTDTSCPTSFSATMRGRLVWTPPRGRRTSPFPHY
jgi:hypothetical protein